MYSANRADDDVTDAMTGRVSFPHRLSRTWKGASPLDQFAATITPAFARAHL